MTLVSSGEKMGDEELLEKARISMEAGTCGLIFGRNVWQRPFNEALKIIRKMKSLMKEFPA